MEGPLSSRKTDSLVYSSIYLLIPLKASCSKATVYFESVICRWRDFDQTWITCAIKRPCISIERETSTSHNSAIEIAMRLRLE